MAYVFSTILGTWRIRLPVVDEIVAAQYVVSLMLPVTSVSEEVVLA
jgi:hypothetical protein